MDLEAWRRHIDQVVDDEGQWLGLLDENGYPLCDLPEVVDVSATETRLDPSSVEVTVSVAGGAGVRTMQELVAADVGRFDEELRLEPSDAPTRLLCVVRPGRRLTYTVTHCSLEGGAVPAVLRISGVDLLEGLSWWPAPSIPKTWVDTTFDEWKTDASGIDYDTPRDLARVEMAQTADGYTIKAPAVTGIVKLIRESFLAVNDLMGWDEPHAYVADPPEDDDSPEALIRTDDSTIWETISDIALQAGVDVQVRLWWPGDDPVDGHTWDYPIQIVTVTKIGRV